MLSKTQQKLMELFVSKITKKFSLLGAGKELGMHQALSYRASQELIKRELIIKNENNLFSLNYKKNHQELVSIEYQRTSDFINSKKHQRLSNFIKETIGLIREDNFILILFGSTIEKTNPRDQDLLFLFDSVKKAQRYEQILLNFKETYPSLNIHINIDSLADYKKMLKARDDPNIINQILNKHLIFYGAELFYRILKQERPYDT